MGSRTLARGFRVETGVFASLTGRGTEKYTTGPNCIRFVAFLLIKVRPWGVGRFALFAAESLGGRVYRVKMEPGFLPRCNRVVRLKSNFQPDCSSNNSQLVIFACILPPPPPSRRSADSIRPVNGTIVSSFGTALINCLILLGPVIITRPCSRSVSRFQNYFDCFTASLPARMLELSLWHNNHAIFLLYNPFFFSFLF